MASMFKIVYDASATLTWTLASLATSSTLVAGRESALVDNTSNLYPDYLFSGFVETGTSPTVSTNIEIWCVGVMNTSYTFPDAWAGADANISVTSRNVLYTAAKRVAIITVDSTSNRKYPVVPTLIGRDVFGGAPPPKFSFWLVQNTGAALNSTGGNHAFYVTPVYGTGT